jgi:hypothetical protein
VCALDNETRPDALCVYVHVWLANHPTLINISLDFQAEPFKSVHLEIESAENQEEH